ncbi:hypothetical protein ACQP2K_05510 [Microbispora siamensis]
MGAARPQHEEHGGGALTNCIGCGCVSMSACRLLNPYDELASQGPGPHRLDPLPADPD